MSSLKKPLPLFFCTLSIMGCASIFSSHKQEIHFNSNTENVDVYNNNEYVGTIPGTLKIDKKTKKSYLDFRKEDYAPLKIELDKKLNPWFLLGILSPGSVAIDLSLGNMSGYKNEFLSVDLRKSDEGSYAYYRSLTQYYDQKEKFKKKALKLASTNVISSSEVNAKPVEQNKEILNERRLSRLKTYDLSDITSNKVSPLDVASINVSNLDLSELPAELKKCRNLIAIDLSDNKLTTVSITSEDFPLLQKINLSRNNLEQLTITSSSLSTIDLSYNQLEYIPRNFSQLKYLNTLKLSNNSINQKTFNELGILNSIINLDLSYNDLEGKLITLPYHFPNVKSLLLRHNGFYYLSSLRGLTALEHLDISDNPITLLPNELTNCKKLKTLNIDGTFIENWDINDPLDKLDELIIGGYNNQRNIIKAINNGNLNHLIRLEIKNINNPLPLSGNNNLSSLSLINCKSITSLGLFLSKLDKTKIRSLKFVNTTVHTLPSDLIKFSNLEELIIRNGGIKEVRAEKFSNIKIIDLAGNNLSDRSMTELLKIKHQDLNSIITFNYLDSKSTFVSNKVALNMQLKLNSLLEKGLSGNSNALLEASKLFEENDDQGMALLCLNEILLQTDDCTDKWIATRTKQADIIIENLDVGNSFIIQMYEGVCSCENNSDFKKKACGVLYKAYTARANQLEQELKRKISQVTNLKKGMENWGLVSAIGSGVQVASKSQNLALAGQATDAFGQFAVDAKEERAYEILDQEIVEIKVEISDLRNKANSLL